MTNDREKMARECDPLANEPLQLSEPPKDRVFYARHHVAMKWTPYKPTSQQFKHGITGRWQELGEYGGWGNSSIKPAAGAWIEDVINHPEAATRLPSLGADDGVREAVADLQDTTPPIPLIEQLSRLAEYLSGEGEDEGMRVVRSAMLALTRCHPTLALGDRVRGRDDVETAAATAARVVADRLHGGRPKGAAAHRYATIFQSARAGVIEYLTPSTGVPCELCGRSVRLGHYVNLYDDIGEAHVNCDDPDAIPTEQTPSPSDDGTFMPTYRMLGDPMTLAALTPANKQEGE